MKRPASSAGVVDRERVGGHVRPVGLVEPQVQPGRAEVLVDGAGVAQGADQRRGPLVDERPSRPAADGRRDCTPSDSDGPIGSHRGARRPGHRHRPDDIAAAHRSECFTPSEGLGRGRPAAGTPMGSGPAGPCRFRGHGGGAAAWRYHLPVPFSEGSTEHAHLLPESQRDPATSGTSSTPTASCSAGCAPRSPASCAASTSRSSPPTSTPATTSSSSTPRRSCSRRARPTASVCTATAATRAASSPRPTASCSPASRRTPSARPSRACCPKGPLGRQMLTKLKVYAGPDHPHAAQSPEPLDLSAAKAR